MKKTITSNDLKNLVNEAHAQVKDLKGGKNANYIPFLDKIDSNLFGISVCLPSGEVIEAGDTNYVFGIESVSKVYTAILVLRQYGAQARVRQDRGGCHGVARLTQSWQFYWKTITRVPRS